MSVEGNVGDEGGEGEVENRVRLCGKGGASAGQGGDPGPFS
jgi:hypothetical protein